MLGMAMPWRPSRSVASGWMAPPKCSVIVSTPTASTFSNAPASTARQASWNADVPDAHAFSIVRIGTSTMPHVCNARCTVPGAPNTVPANTASIVGDAGVVERLEHGLAHEVAGRQLGLLAEQRGADTLHGDVPPRGHWCTIDWCTSVTRGSPSSVEPARRTRVPGGSAPSVRSTWTSRRGPSSMST